MKAEDYEIIDFGDLKPGDKLIGTNDEITAITDVYDKHIPEKMYELEMKDGELVRASSNHLWYCETEHDIKNKDLYKKIAEEYFDDNVVPKEERSNPYFPLNEMIKMFGDSVNTQLFIEHACRSLGYSSMTPHIITEDMCNSKVMEVYNYDYNNLIVFINKMKSAIIKKEGYFYFGQVRTTEEIAEILSHGLTVDIPHESDIK